MQKALLNIDWRIYASIAVSMVFAVFFINMGVMQTMRIGYDYSIVTNLVKALLFPITFLILIILFNITQLYVKNLILLIVVTGSLLGLLVLYFDQYILHVYIDYVIRKNVNNPNVALYSQNNLKYFGSNAVYIRVAMRYLFLVLSLLTYHFWFLKHQKDRIEKDRKKYELAALESEMGRLRSQVNPHFLFNSINAIISESHDPKLVEEIGRELANVLRYNLSQTAHAAMFSEEVDVISSYLRVSKVRFENNLEIKMNISDEARGVKTPQPLLLPLIENALKYSFRTTQGRVLLNIEANVNGGYLTASVENTGSWIETLVPAKPGTQLGLSNLKDRLGLEYQDRAKITVDKFTNSVRVSVALPVNT